MSTPTGSTPSPSTDRPTRTRYWVIVFAVTLAIVQYVDRVAISQAMPDIAAEMQFSDAQKGMIFSAFTLAYALFEIPTGWLGDKLGAKKVLIRVVLWWSFFTAATGWAWSYASMLVTRFLFGAGEAGCFPNLTKALSTWLPKADRTRAQALMWMGARWGGAAAPLLVVAVMAFVSWRTAFMLFAIFGVVWAVIFYLWFRDNPREHPGVNAAELELLKENEHNVAGHGNVPWKKLVSRPAMWLLWAQYFCLSYGWYFYVTWLPTYLRDERGMDIKSNAFMGWLSGLLEGSMSPEMSLKVLAAALAGIPLFFGGFGSLTAGLISGRLISRGANVRNVRRAFGVIGLTGASTLLMASFYIRDPLLAMLSMGLASFSNDLTMPGSWASCMDIGGKYAGTVSGSMNMMGNFGGMAGPIVVGLVLSLTSRDWQLAFAISAVIYFLGAVCWLFIDPVTPLEKEEG
ncbi:putative sulfoacetate transporter SauU [Lacunisphaera limnophila]|uniref:Putative sulfoacetate transporter SauU n=1 Tax=Lacunisphaera limnophila TaxID=1838286 RepID=A0A1D8AZ99_9BACT|nr:MFS transporter [Lacunisphaera limnophila]AOS46201.1 putative sulfoacetate transporter SauU [Lacunisphaera limnophila]